MAVVRFDQFKQNTCFDSVSAPLARTDNSFSPIAGLAWQPSDSESYYASCGRSFQPSAETFALAANKTAIDPAGFIQESVRVELVETQQPSSGRTVLGVADKSCWIYKAPEITRDLEIGTKLDFLNEALSVNAALLNLQPTKIKNTDPISPALSINAGR